MKHSLHRIIIYPMAMILTLQFLLFLHCFFTVCDFRSHMVVKSDGSDVPSAEVAARLWDISEAVVAKWEKSQLSD